MTTMLFTYRVRFQKDGKEYYNDNFVNPLAVANFYWQLLDDGNHLLMIALTNQRTLQFPEPTGRRFVEHIEDFLRYMALGRTEAPYSRDKTRRSYTAPQNRTIVEEIDESNQDPQSPAATWEAGT